MPRIAIVEDDEPTRITLHLVLTNERYETILIQGPGDDRGPARRGPELTVMDAGWYGTQSVLCWTCQRMLTG